MKPDRKLTLAILIAFLWLIGSPVALRAQTLKSTGYLIQKEARVYLVTQGQSAVLSQALRLTPELTVLTNGIIRITGGGEAMLPEGRELTLDGFWVGEDGTLLEFKPHYIIKKRTVYFVKNGVMTRVDQDVTFKNGFVLRADCTILTPESLAVWLQDGQKLSASGYVIPALDQVAMVDGKLVLEKDGSIIPLPEGGRIGMSDGTVVAGSGLITFPNRDNFVLQDGERLTLDGSGSSRILW